MGYAYLIWVEFFIFFGNWIIGECILIHWVAGLFFVLHSSASVPYTPRIL